jgi:hypothetical protein
MMFADYPLSLPHARRFLERRRCIVNRILLVAASVQYPANVVIASQ